MGDRTSFKLIKQLRKHTWTRRNRPSIYFVPSKFCRKRKKYIRYMWIFVDNTGKVRITKHRDAFFQKLLQWKGTMYYTASVCVCVCSLRYPAFNAHSSIFSSVACPAPQYFSTLSHKRHDFRKKKSPKTKCVFWFSLQLLSETFLILRRN